MPSADSITPEHRWFHEARYGLFIHWGPYVLHGRGEQVLMRELMDQRAYAEAARAWCPSAFDAEAWADVAVRGGFRYAVFTTRHHDGYCNWATDTTDYSSASQAPRRDYVRAFVDAFRARGLRIGLYYSWSDFREPALFAGPLGDPEGWRRFRAKVHAQVLELMTHYGRIDVLWFDGVWPRTAAEWGAGELVREVRRLQPGILVNNRLGWVGHAGGVGADEAGANEGEAGDFGTPEHHIVADPRRLWESCQVSTWRLWCHSVGERWRPADVLLDFLTDAACKGGNLLLNVGPDAEGRIPDDFVRRSDEIGEWLRVHGEAVFGVDPVDAGETVLFGRQCRRGRSLYLVVRFWPGEELRFQGLASRVERAVLLGSSRKLEVLSEDRGVLIRGLPRTPPTSLFPVVRLDLAEEPRTHPTYHPGLWGGDPRRLLAWARSAQS